jgi:hypothetical protein
MVTTIIGFSWAFSIHNSDTHDTDYDIYYVIDARAKPDEGILFAHSSDMIKYYALLPVDMSFWIIDYSGDDDISFTVTLERAPDKHHVAVLHNVIIMTDEQGEIIYEVDLVK